MSKVMLINVTHAEESRVAIIDGGRLVSFEIESLSREHLKGNIYKGVVHRVHAGLEAAFVDIGAGRDAFLPLDEICFRPFGAEASRQGNGSEDGKEGERRKPKIQDLLSPGQEILVQIVKEQFGTKPPTLSTFYSLPGRFLVLLPGSDQTGISRRIEGADRQKVRDLVGQLSIPEGFGTIVRTVAGFDPELADFERDLTYLLRLWESIQGAAAHRAGPTLIYREHDLVLRNIRDFFTPDIEEIHVDNEEVFLHARDFLRSVMPEKESSLRLYDGNQPIFSRFHVEPQIETIYKRHVHLKSGGYIVIDGTEALTAIDVNSGRSVKGASQEETAFKTNLEAATEAARQLRLRDLGGLVVIDFIDMRNAQHIAEVEKALRQGMTEDKARHEIGRISQFGLVEISRQRLRPAATASTYVDCPMCEGHGLVRTTESAALVALRKVHHRVAQNDTGNVSLALPPDVAIYLLNQKRGDLAELERRYGTRIHVQLRPGLMPHQSEIEVQPRSESPEKEGPVLRLGGVAGLPTAATAPSLLPTAAGPEGPEESEQQPGEPSTSTAATGEPRRRRRRGRRRGKGNRTTAVSMTESSPDIPPVVVGASPASPVSEPAPPRETAPTPPAGPVAKAPERVSAPPVSAPSVSAPSVSAPPKAPTRIESPSASAPSEAAAAEAPVPPAPELKPAAPGSRRRPRVSSRRPRQTEAASPRPENGADAPSSTSPAPSEGSASTPLETAPTPEKARPKRPRPSRKPPAQAADNAAPQDGAGEVAKPRRPARRTAKTTPPAETSETTRTEPSAEASLKPRRRAPARKAKPAASASETPES